MNAPTLPTLDTAARDADGLTISSATGKPLGLFAHRRLAEDLNKLGFNIWNTDAEKVAFLNAPTEIRVAALLRELKQYDLSKGASNEPPPPAPAQAAPAVEPPAAPAPAESGKRAPRTSAAQEVAPAAQQSVGVQELLLVLGRMESKVDSLASALEALTKSVGITLSAGNDIKGMLSASIRVQNLQLGLQSLVSQQALGVQPEEFVVPALEDASRTLDVLEKTSGKA